ncbi:hypothetical protein LINGRAHAP2_LOCUS8723 [Linum grandiflorum]
MMIVACSSEQEVKTVHLTNDYGQTVNAYCRSRDNKIRGDKIDPGLTLSWSFKDNSIRTTLFWCDLSVEGKSLHFDIYRCQNDKIYIMAMVIKMVVGMMMMIMGCSSNETRSTVQLANDYGQTVKVHCESRGNKIKASEIEPGSTLSWSFHDNIVCSTLFWCDLAVEDKYLHFDIYKCYMQSEYPTSWWIDRDGVHPFNFDQSLGCPWNSTHID